MPSTTGATPDSGKPYRHESLARLLYPHARIQLLKAQGGCSTTFLIEDRRISAEKSVSSILQFRASKFRLSIDITADAKVVYQKYAPWTRKVDLSRLGLTGEELDHDHLVCYEMEVMKGVAYSSLVQTHSSTDEPNFDRQKRLVEDFADFISLSWPAQPWPKRECSGRVGSQIRQKLLSLSRHLPFERLRVIAKQALDKIELLSFLPVVLNHGDVIPSNIMVDPCTLSIHGLVDWAEAEYLPFGTCLYGLEYLLGSSASKRRRDSVVTTHNFQYHAFAAEVRNVFWQRLQLRIPALEGDDEMMEAVLLAKVVGTLLWYGFAWDDGAIDRVVNVADDEETLGLLEAFLSHNLDGFLR